MSAKRRLTLFAIILLIAATSVFAKGRAVASPGAAPTDPVKKFVFETNQLEFYLGDDGIAYIRPGVKITVASITDVAPGKKPVVEVFFTDNFDQPLDRLGKITPGAISPSFILSWYDPATREYTPYTTRTVTTPANSPHPGVTAIQAGADAGGKWTDLELGHAKYTFGTTLPSTVDVTKTHTLGIYATRNLTDILGKNYYVNVEKDFRPDGGTINTAETWDKMNPKSATCNNCHDPLSAHGGSRQDVKLCVLCHNPTTSDPDTGESLDMEYMIHKIHSANYPAPSGNAYPKRIYTKPFVIVGFNQAVNDFSEVTYPQDVRNCATCHEGLTTAQKASQSHLWYSAPTRDACGACHDAINWTTGEHHPGGSQLDDSRCANCHIPDSGAEFDASIKGAHTIPTKSAQLKGLNVTVVSVTNLAPGKNPTIAFKITNNDGTVVDGSKLTRFGATVGGPTSSYTTYIRESTAKPQFDSATGNSILTFTNKVPDDATGTWVVTGDFYRNVDINRTVADPAGRTTITVREAAFNPIKYMSLTGGTAEPRRTVVAISQCNQCHDRLALHGGQRMNTQECVVCHNPTATATVTGQTDKESISFQRMIHRIHTGDELTRPYVIGNTAFNEVTFPGDRRNCAKCHTGDSQQLPAAGDPVVTPNDFFSPQGSGTAACLGCHDGRDAAAHAFLNTAQFGGQPAEACGTCHGKNSTWSVDKVHAR